MFESLDKAKNILTLDEQRFRANYGPVTGGNTVYKQEQDHSVEWLAKRDSQPPPSPNAAPVIPPPSPNPPPPAAAEPAATKSFDADDVDIFEGELVYR